MWHLKRSFRTRTNPYNPDSLPEQGGSYTSMRYQVGFREPARLQEGYNIEQEFHATGMKVPSKTLVAQNPMSPALTLWQSMGQQL